MFLRGRRRRDQRRKRLGTPAVPGPFAPGSEHGGNAFFSLDEDGLGSWRSLITAGAGAGRCPHSVWLDSVSSRASVRRRRGGWGSLEVDDYGWALCVRDRKENVDQLRAAVETLAEEARQVTREGRRRRLMLRVSRLRWRLLEAEWLEAYNWENGEAALIRAIEPIPPEQFEAYRTGLGIPLLVLWNARRRSS